MPRYTIMFHAVVNTTDEREALEVARKIGEVVACSPELFHGAYDPVEIFDLDEFEKLEEDDEDGN